MGPDLITPRRVASADIKTTLRAGKAERVGVATQASRAEVRPPKRPAEALIPGTSGCELIWKQGGCRCDSLS